MIPKSGFVHPLYEQIWQYVKSDRRDRTCDTHLVSQLLMTSGLPVDVLGGLWSMANVGVEGSLSQQELYIILALITLVQVILQNLMWVNCTHRLLVVADNCDPLYTWRAYKLST